MVLDHSSLEDHSSTEDHSHLEDHSGLEDHGGTEHPRPAHEHLGVLADEGLLPEARRVVPRDAVVVPEIDNRCSSFLNVFADFLMLKLQPPIWSIMACICL